MEPGLPPDTRLIAAGQLDHPECAAWDAVDKRLVAGGEDGQIYRIELDTGAVDLVAHRPGSFFCGLALDAAGDVYACDIVSGHVERVTAEGRITPHGERIGVPNYPVFDADGTLFVTDSGTHRGDNGRLMRIGPDGTTERVPLSRPLAFPNGLALRSGLVYIVESDASRVVRVSIEGGEPETVVDLPGTVPDGLAFDTSGALWISCYQPNRIYRLAEQGDPDIVAEDAGGWILPMPTNICFGGEDLTTLVAACLGGWFLTAFDAPCAGEPLNRPPIKTGASRS